MKVFVFTYKVGVCVQPEDQHRPGEVELYANSVADAQSKANKVLMGYKGPLTGRTTPRDVKTAQAILKLWP